LFSLQAYYAKSLLRKHCKEGATVITYFWVTPNFFPFIQKKKNLHGAVLNGTVQLLLRYTCRGKEEEDFKSFFPLTFSFSFPSHLPTKPGHKPHPIPCHH
jgi:hypothetical protein